MKHLEEEPLIWRASECDVLYRGTRCSLGVDAISSITFLREGDFLVHWVWCVYVGVLCCVQLFATPWTIAHQAPLSMGFPRQEYWNRLPFSFPGNLPNPGIKPTSPASAGRFFITKPTEKSKQRDCAWEKQRLENKNMYLHQFANPCDFSLVMLNSPDIGYRRHILNWGRIGNCQWVS